MAQSNTIAKTLKTTKPYAGFPLTPHPSGRWCKKIRGKLHYFGKTDDHAAALERFNREWPYLKDGRTPPPVDTGDGCTVRLLCNAFLTIKKAKLESGELAPRSFQNYFRTSELLIEHFGRDRRVDDLRPDDFDALRKSLAKTRGPVALKNEVNHCRIVFKFAFDNGLIEKPIRYGQSFDRPSAKTIRKARHDAGLKLFNFDETKQILDALAGEAVTVSAKDGPVTVTLKADPVIRAMVLLGLNCGFGNTDCATLPKNAVDLAAGWIDFPRPKTGIHRRIPLWPETIEALKAAIAVRPEPKTTADADLVFLTRNGVRWVRVQENRKKTSTVNLDALSQRFAKLLKGLGINSHRNFYTLRHNFETIGGESKDQVAVDSIMGHVDPSMAAVYRERISDARLKAVVNVVRKWVFPKKKRRSK